MQTHPLDGAHKRWRYPRGPPKKGYHLSSAAFLCILKPDVYFDDAGDGYGVYTKDGSLLAHFEHTVVITEKGAEILTK